VCVTVVEQLLRLSYHAVFVWSVVTMGAPVTEWMWFAFGCVLMCGVDVCVDVCVCVCVCARGDVLLLLLFWVFFLFLHPSALTL